MKTIHHVGISVSDLDQAIRFYHDVLELEFSNEPSPVFDDPRMGALLGVPGAALRQACLRCGESLIELQEYVAPEPPNSAPPPPNAIGAAHIGFRVTNIEARKQDLERRGVEFLSDVNIGEGTIEGWSWVYFHDTCGNTLELVEEVYAVPDKRAAGIAEYQRRRMQSTGT